MARRIIDSHAHIGGRIIDSHGHIGDIFHEKRYANAPPEKCLKNIGN